MKGELYEIMKIIRSLKKMTGLFLAVAMIVPFVRTCPAKALSFPLKTTVHSESAMLINLDSDMIIHEKNADTKQMPGTLVNIMTAVVVLENCDNLNEEVTISESLYEDLFNTQYPDDLRWTDVVDGDILTVLDLLYSMMMTSSMEASMTLANKIGGSIEAFVGMMNETARDIGLESTNFTNVTGLFDENQYTTARDMYTLTKYALKVPLFDKISSTYSYNPTVPNVKNHEHHESWFWYNINPMLDPESEYYYTGAKGIKTASLEAAGRNLVALASRDGNNYLVVLLRAPMNNADGYPEYFHLEDAEALFDWAFDHFSYQAVLSSSAEMGEVPVSLADGNGYVLARPAEEFSLLWYDEVDISTVNKSDIMWYKDSLQAPVEAGEPLGQVRLTYSGEELGTVELVAVSDVKRSFVKYNMYAVTQFPKSKWFKNAIVISIIFCMIYILMCIYAAIIFKNKNKPVKPKYTMPKVEKNSDRNRRK